MVSHLNGLTIRVKNYLSELEISPNAIQLGLYFMSNLTQFLGSVFLDLELSVICLIYQENITRVLLLLKGLQLSLSFFSRVRRNLVLKLNPWYWNCGSLIFADTIHAEAYSMLQNPYGRKMLHFPSYNINANQIMFMQWGSGASKNYLPTKARRLSGNYCKRALTTFSNMRVPCTLLQFHSSGGHFV